MPWLQWYHREDDLTRAARAPYRLLTPVPANDRGDADAPNLLIQGDNLDALKSLLPYYAGQVKCVFIDPPSTPAARSCITTTADGAETRRWRTRRARANAGSDWRNGRQFGLRTQLRCIVYRYTINTWR